MYLSSGALLSMFRRTDSTLPPTFFFHIPKCAGSSIWESIFDIYGYFNVFIVSSEREQRRFAQMSKSRLRSYLAIGGHGFLHDYRTPLGDLTGYRKIVVFRDPTDRLISEYNFIRRTKNHFLFERVSKQSFSEFVSSGWRNTQTHILTGKEDDLDGAIDLVNNFFDDWALMDDIEELVERLYISCGKKPRSIMHKNNAAPVEHRSFSRSSDIVQLMEQCQGGDLRLFDYLKSLRSRGTANDTQARSCPPSPMLSR
jgi:hypothetical protein